MAERETHGQKRRRIRGYILRKQGFVCANESCRTPLTDETANLYHKRSRFDKDRRAPSHGKHVYEVMCRPCCNKLSAVKEARQPIELLHFNSKRHPTDEYWYVPEEGAGAVVGGSSQP